MIRNLLLPAYNFCKEAIAAPSSGRKVSLDLLRAVAIFMVLFRHGNTDVLAAIQSENLFVNLIYWLKQVGWAGVDLFFVLSGFLIAGLIFNEIKTNGMIDFRRFWLRRALKIFPLYYAYMLLVLGMLLLRSDFNFRHALSAIWPNLLNIQNYFWTPAGHTWSLAVEEHFYLALPLLCSLLYKAFGGVRYIIPSMLAVACGCLILRWRHWVSGGVYSHEYVLWPTHFRIDGLAWGVLISYLWVFNVNGFIEKCRRAKPWLLLSGLALLSIHLLYELESPVMWVWGFSVNYLAFGFLLLFCLVAEDSLRASVICRMLAKVGAYSYPIYLFHFGVSEPFVDFLNGRSFLVGAPILKWMIVFSTYLIISIGIGCLLHRLIEAPILYARDRLFPASR